MLSLRSVRWGLIVCLAGLAAAAVPQPADWVPARWPWADAQSLELLQDTPINCLLLPGASPELAAAAAARGLVTLAVLAPGPDAVAAARRALDAKVTGLVLDGDFPDAVAASVREAAGSAPVVELSARSRMPLGSTAPILGTYQGVWPGISLQDDGEKKAGPTGSTWIDTNTGFIRAARAWGGAEVWIGNQPPAGAAIAATRYLQVIADAAASGARWVLALDSDFAARLHRRDADSLAGWRRMGALLRYFEDHPEWRRMREFGQLAVVQDPAKGGLLSGGILDMIAVKHTPVRPIPRQRLSQGALAGATMAVNVDPDSLTAQEKDVLRDFTHAGNTVLTGPPGWKDQGPSAGITLTKTELNRLNEIWRDVNSMIGRRNLGVRLFNVSSMLSNALASPDGKTVVLHLVNYSDFPVEDVTVQFSGEFHHATLLTPDGRAKPLEIYPAEDSHGVDIDKIAICATIKLE
jgi:hypothetical protein